MCLTQLEKRRLEEVVTYGVGIRRGDFDHHLIFDLYQHTTGWYYYQTRVRTYNRSISNRLTPTSAVELHMIL